MKKDIDGLLRLAGTQREFARLLESRIVRTCSRLEELGRNRADMLLAVERASTAGLVVYAAAMRRLAEMDNARAAMEQAVSDMNRKLLKARGAHDALMGRADELVDVQSRKAVEEDAREVALAMKATGKHRMLK